MKKYAFLADQITKKANKDLKKTFSFKRSARFLNGISASIVASGLQYLGWKSFNEQKRLGLLKRSDIAPFGLISLITTGTMLSGLNEFYRGYAKSDQKKQFYKAAYIQNILKNKLKSQA